MRGLVLALACATLGGCFSHPPAPDLRQEADPFCRAIGSWMQLGVYDAMAKLARVEEHGPAFWLPFEEAPPGFRLSRVEWTVEGPRYDSVYAVDAAPGGRANLTGLAAPDVSDDEVRARLVSLALDATNASQDEALAWADAFLASRHGALVSADGAGHETIEQYGYFVEIDAARLRLDGLAAALDAKSARVEERGRWSWGDAWRFDFSAPYRLAKLAGAPEPIGLTAEAGGLVRASDDGTGDPATRDGIAAAMLQAGLPAPAFEGWRSGSGIC